MSSAASSGPCELGCEGAAGDLCMDGSIGSRTTALCAPYADAETAGHLYLDADQVDRACRRLHAGGHPGRLPRHRRPSRRRGGRGLRGGRGPARDGRGRRRPTPARARRDDLAGPDASPRRARSHREHAARCSTPTGAATGGLYAQRLGADRATAMNAFASMSTAGVPLAFGSDTPVTPFDPWAGVRAADPPPDTVGAHQRQRGVRRLHPAAAGAPPAATTAGVIAVGAPASLAVWDAADAGAGQPPDVAPDARAADLRDDDRGRGGRVRAGRGDDMTVSTSSTSRVEAGPRPGHRPQGPQPRAAGRPPDRHVGQEAHHCLGRACDAAAGRAARRRPRRHPVGQPPARRRTRRCRARARHLAACLARAGERRRRRPVDAGAEGLRGIRALPGARGPRPGPCPGGGAQAGRRRVQAGRRAAPRARAPREEVRRPRPQALDLPHRRNR